MSGTPSAAPSLLATSGAEQSPSSPPLRQRHKRHRTPTEATGGESAAARALAIYEIAEMVISLARRADLHSIARVCKGWNAVSMPLLYRTIRIDCTEPPEHGRNRFDTSHERRIERCYRLNDILVADKSKARLVHHLIVAGLKDPELCELLSGCSALVDLDITLGRKDWLEREERGKKSHARLTGDTTWDEEMPLLQKEACRHIRALDLSLAGRGIGRRGWDGLVGGLTNLHSLTIADPNDFPVVEPCTTGIFGTVTRLTLTHHEDQYTYLGASHSVRRARYQIPYGGIPIYQEQIQEQIDEFIAAFKHLRHLLVDSDLATLVRARSLPSNLKTLELQAYEPVGYFDIIRHLTDVSWLPHLRGTPILRVGEDMSDYMGLAYDPGLSHWPPMDEVRLLVQHAEDGLRARSIWKEEGEGEASLKELLSLFEYLTTFDEDADEADE